LIAVSRRIADVLRAGGIAPERMRVVYEGVRDRKPQPGGREALRALGVPGSALVVGNVAALTDHKDHRTLLSAAAALLKRRDDVCFVILGEGELRPALESHAAQLGLGARCLFLGFRDDLDRLIPAFDVFCLSSHMEGLGTSLLDAMCFARPVVATSAGGIPEAVADATSGTLVPPREPQALARALSELLDAPDRRAAYGAAGRRIFEERFTEARMVEETLRVLGKV
jgi:glycosyltransferase involved in cell wall biosynthesis